MFRMLRTLPFTLALAGLSIFTASCGSSSSKFRLVHAVADGQAVDVVIDGKTVETAVAVNAATPSTGYLSVSSGTRHIQVFPTGTTTGAYFDGNVTLNSSADYTFLLSGVVLPASTITGTLLTDNNTAPTSSNAELRVIHASTFGPTPVDIYVTSPGGGITGPPSISSVAYQNASTYLNVPEGTYDILVTPAGLPAIDIRVADAAFIAGKIYTYVLIDIPGGGQMSGDPLLLNDN